MANGDLSNTTLLLIATKNNQFEDVKELLELEEIDVNEGDSLCNITALHLASESGFLNTVQLLLEHNANINAQTYDGYTPLHLSIQQEHADVAEYLIQSGADINFTDNWGWIPLHNVAATGCSIKLANDLIEKEINVNAKADDGRTPLHFAADYNFHEIASVLIEHGAEIEATSEDDWTPLHIAAYKGNTNVAKLLLEKGANTESNTNKFTTPLHFAADNNFVTIVELLLENKANINALHDAGWTPLHFAAVKGHAEIVTSLLKHGADFNIMDIPENATPLHCACRYGHSDVLKILIAKGDNVNKTMTRNVTPLHIAVMCHNLNIVEILLANGAYFDSKVQGSRAPTPLSYAHEHKNFEAVTKLKLIETLFSAIINNSSSAVKRCIRMGVFLDCKSIEYESPLLYAAKMGYIKILSSFLKQGVNINIANEDNLTPLHYAAKNKHSKIVTILLQHGAIFNIETKSECKTPLNFANDKDTLKILTLTTELFNEMSGDKHKAIEKINVLKTQSRNIISAITNAHDKNGDTLMQVAVNHNHKDIADMLSIELQLNTAMESQSLK